MYQTLALEKCSSGKIGKFLRKSAIMQHSRQALFLLCWNIRWKNSYFEAIQSVESGRILDEEALWNGRAKTAYYRALQINAYTLRPTGLLLIGPAGTA